MGYLKTFEQRVGNLNRERDKRHVAVIHKLQS